MEENFGVRKGLTANFIYDKNSGKNIDIHFDRGSVIDFVNNTIIADYTNIDPEKRKYYYKVVSFVEGRKISSYECFDLKVLDNGNLKLVLEPNYEGIKRSFIFNTEKGKKVSDIYVDMSDVQPDGTLVVTKAIDSSRGHFTYVMKIDNNGELVSDVINVLTEEVIPREHMAYDENNTLNNIINHNNRIHLKAFTLERKPPIVNED